MKAFFKSILSISVFALSQSCEPAHQSVAPARETPPLAVDTGAAIPTSEKETPPATFYGQKSIAVAFVLTNLH